VGGRLENVLSQAVREFGHICFYYYMHMLTFTKPTESGSGRWGGVISACANNFFYP